ncbi:MAG: polysaccharide deacetylase family protein [Clostridia bacterium]|nr:polysaccharide deacetylase family protein [Clostridia bacterium]
MLRKNNVIVFITCILLVAILCVITSVTGSAVVFTGGATKLLPIYSVERNDNKISISFDCAYGVDYTDKLLQILNEYNVKCTFFAVEFWVDKYPEYAKKIVDNGHELQTHSATHPKMSKLSKQEIVNELTTSINKIESVTGKKVTLFRAPYGDYDNLVIETASEMGLYTIQWDVDSIDWKDISQKEIADRVISKTKSGSIILCHNNGLNTSKALPSILARLKEKGFEFVKISDLIYKQNYQINAFGKQIPNA